MDRTEFTIGAVLSVLVGLMIIAACHDCNEKERLVKQCMDDGKKEYECKAMFHTKNSTTVIPVYTGR